MPRVILSSLCQLGAMEIKTCLLPPSFLVSSPLPRYLQGACGPPQLSSVQSLKMKNHCSPLLFFPPLFAACGTNFCIFFDLMIHSKSSRLLFSTISDHPKSFSCLSRADIHRDTNLTNRHKKKRLNTEKLDKNTNNTGTKR